jgi:carboxypeptidase Taq
MSDFQKLWDALKEISDISGAISLMSWDQEVIMPPGGAAMRARQLSTLHGISHQKFVEDAGILLAKANESTGLDDFQRLNLKEITRGHKKLTKLPKEFVISMSRLTSESLPKWVEARKNNDFSLFAPNLEKIVDAKIQQAEYMGYQENPYDALIDDYEPSMTARKLKAVFEPFKESLSGLLMAIKEKPQVDDSFLLEEIGQEAQMGFCSNVVEKLGYNLTYGRQDLSAHPFSIGMNAQDVRITTMIQNNDIREMLYSSIHEAGHAMYEQGLPLENYGLPAGEYCSLSIHESQSRLWENNVGRGMAFWEHFLPELKKTYGGKLDGKSAEDIFKAANQVKPGLIRISCDELTYHFHVILRFEIENDLINKKLKVKDLPEAWNAKVKEYMGLDVPNDSQGVLQDIHWSHGSIGYFPTYSLGSFYAAQLMHFAKQAIPGIEEQFAKGDFSALKGWLAEQIHKKGRIYNAEELCTQATGEPLDVKYFTDYAWEKFGRIYGIKRPNTIDN